MVTVFYVSPSYSTIFYAVEHRKKHDFFYFSFHFFFFFSCTYAFFLNRRPHCRSNFTEKLEAFRKKSGDTQTRVKFFPVELLEGLDRLPAVLSKYTGRYGYDDSLIPNKKTCIREYTPSRSHLYR